MEPRTHLFGDPRVSREEYPTNDVTAFANELDLSKFEVMTWAPVWMTRAERLLLFSMTFCLRPERYLEIGTLHGGSAMVVSAAMDALQSDGKIICIDPQPLVDPDHWASIEHRSVLIEDYSPNCLEHAVEVAGGHFDMVLVDGEHTRAAVNRDVDGALPFLNDGAYIFFHDSYYGEVRAGIEDVLERYPDQLVDFGTMTREVTADPNQTHWGGVRMIQVRRPRDVPGAPTNEPAAETVPEAPASPLQRAGSAARSTGGKVARRAKSELLKRLQD